MRVWPGWHHHMTLVAMAMLFFPKLCTQVHAQVPLLSVRDITELLDYYLPRKRLDEAGDSHQYHRQASAQSTRHRAAKTHSRRPTSI
ncbi:MAG: hypothetical protein J6386_03375 [Candidatus Synoicihabitans palmerolidicus]|nr:hypothetical protein [Candidatus Synoicihabitans palmerolidicus]